MNLKEYLHVLIPLIVVGDLILNFLIIRLVPYTEIDWIAYMQEVGGVLRDGELDYSQLRGDTGPLVYPAGFVWIYSVFYYVTDYGENILLAQYIFAGLHSLFLGVVLLIYRYLVEDNKFPVVGLILLCLSRRIHSIFVLRLFNDCWAMLFLYISILFFIKHRWVLGSLIFSVALSIKMNILLFMPPLLVILVKSSGFGMTFLCMMVILVFQVVVGIPFLMHDYWAYLRCSFNFSREFFYIWTVNWKMVSEELFLSKPFSTVLLAAHLGVLIFFGFKWCGSDGGVFAALFGTRKPNLSPSYIIFLLFSGNFIGMMFSRSLHYQFYVWYYHTLPALLWFTGYPVIIKIALLLAIEVVWNVYPSVPWSSSLLLASHSLILVGLIMAKLPSVVTTKAQKKKIR